jgi:hypothetical protein
MEKVSKDAGTKRPVGSTAGDPIRINLSDGFTADELMKGVKSKFKEIQHVHDHSKTAHVAVGKNIGGKTTTGKNIGRPPRGAGRGTAAAAPGAHKNIPPSPPGF